MGNSREYMKGSILIISLKWLGATGFVALLAAILFPVFAPGSRCYKRLNCLSNLKQLGTAIAIYQSDADDQLPPYFTFDGPEQAETFVNVTFPYSKSKEIFLCIFDNGPVPAGQEGLPGKLSFVHCLSFKSKIPDFIQGNRTIRVTNTFPNIATTPFLREPIRGASFSGMQTFKSPHGEGFSISYLDTHVKFRKPLDINTEL